ncbi:MAG: hypothetical protein ACJ79E_01470 [Anaeromyxobacteraceae bacterium]
MNVLSKRSFLAALSTAALLAGCTVAPSDAPRTTPPGTTPPPTTTPPGGTTPPTGTPPPVGTPPPTTTPPPVTTPPPADTVVDAAPPPNAPSPPPPADAGQGLRISAPQGLYLLAPPLAGEASFEGPVLVQLNGGVPPGDTTVELNGVALVRTTTTAQGAANKFWAIDPAVPLPPLRGDDAVVLTARTGSVVRSLTLPCPPDLAVTVSAGPGASLAGATTLRIAWTGDLAVNTRNSLVTDFFASAHLRALDLATQVAEPGRLAQRLVPHGATQVVLDVPATAATGYAAELRWQGAFVQDGSSDGFCGRVKRLVFAR